jgi:energy-converting hydrogenase Eha subunit E
LTVLEEENRLRVNRIACISLIRSSATLILPAGKIAIVGTIEVVACPVTWGVFIGSLDTEIAGIAVGSVVVGRDLGANLVIFVHWNTTYTYVSKRRYCWLELLQEQEQERRCILDVMVL